MDVFSTELGIRLSFVKTLEFREGGGVDPHLVCHWCKGSKSELRDAEFFPELTSFDYGYTAIEIFMTRVMAK
jgi:hypothetical protein